MAQGVEHHGRQVLRQPATHPPRHSPPTNDQRKAAQHAPLPPLEDYLAMVPGSSSKFGVKGVMALIN